MASIDLPDAYYTVAIHPHHQKYLKFVVLKILMIPISKGILLQLAPVMLRPLLP